MENKIPFFKKILLSIKDLDKYNLLIAEKLRRAIYYLLGLMVIFSLIVSGAMTYKTSEIINNSSKYIKDEMPNFIINEEGLNVEQENAFIEEIAGDLKLKVVLDDEAENTDKYKEEIESYDGDYILALKNKLVVATSSAQTEVNYSELMANNNITEINKDTLINLYESNKTQINVAIYITIFIITYFMYTLSAIIDALALSLLVIIISKMAKIPLKYSQTLTIAISALTLPIIINIIYSCANILSGFYMPYFQIMYTLISYIYIVAVILIMRSDLIKKKQLIKATIEIQELQKKMENKDNNEDKKEENKEEKEKNNENKETGKKEKDKPIGDVKKRVKDKLDKDHPEPQANIEGGDK